MDSPVRLPSCVPHAASLRMQRLSSVQHVLLPASMEPAWDREREMGWSGLGMDAPPGSSGCATGASGRGEEQLERVE
jgi:hypothetical protein